MKKLILAGLFVVGSSVSLMADYIAAQVRCDHSSGKGYTYFLVKGEGDRVGILKSKAAIGDFINSEYAVETDRYCENGKVWNSDANVYYNKSKSKANRKFGDMIDGLKSRSYMKAKKIILIRDGYNQSDWR